MTIITYKIMYINVSVIMSKMMMIIIINIIIIES
jgi:hypothetical protein